MAQHNRPRLVTSIKSFYAQSLGSDCQLRARCADGSTQTKNVLRLQPNWFAALRIVHDQSQRRSARFQLRAHFLDLRGLLFQAGSKGFNFLCSCAMVASNCCTLQPCSSTTRYPLRCGATQYYVEIAQAREVVKSDSNPVRVARVHLTYKQTRTVPWCSVLHNRLA